MRSSRCRITFAVPSPRQNFRSLDFDQRKSTLSSSQLPVWNNQPPRIFRQNSEMRLGRRKSPLSMPFCPGGWRRLQPQGANAAARGGACRRGGAGRERRRRAASRPPPPPPPPHPHPGAAGAAGGACSRRAPSRRRAAAAAGGAGQGGSVGGEPRAGRRPARFLCENGIFFFVNTGSSPHE
jgi:hypothetical protein